MKRLRSGLPLIAMALLVAADRPAKAFQGPPRSDMQRGPDQDGPPPPPMQPSPMHVGPPGKWWSDPRFAQRLGLTMDQQKKMETIFQQNRLKLIDFSAALQKQEALLEPLLAADRPDEAAVLAQIDRVAQARGDLEKANARMLLGLRGVLTQAQWNQLQAEAPPRREQPPRR